MRSGKAVNSPQANKEREHFMSICQWKVYSLCAKIHFAIGLQPQACSYFSSKLQARVVYKTIPAVRAAERGQG